MVFFTSMFLDFQVWLIVISTHIYSYLGLLPIYAGQFYLRDQHFNRGMFTPMVTLLLWTPTPHMGSHALVSHLCFLCPQNHRGDPD